MKNISTLVFIIILAASGFTAFAVTGSISSSTGSIGQKGSETVNQNGAYTAAEKLENRIPEEYASAYYCPGYRPGDRSGYRPGYRSDGGNTQTQGYAFPAETAGSRLAGHMGGGWYGPWNSGSNWLFPIILILIVTAAAGFIIYSLQGKHRDRFTDPYDPEHYASSHGGDRKTGEEQETDGFQRDKELKDEAIRILKLRLARGDISRDEYQELKADLTADDGETK
ncbi:MAG: SHOCT domain-containing protein [Spirochaetales bacterium]|nr:SHOCT domain-containing protein [Spirochaetales bacterium]